MEKLIYPHQEVITFYGLENKDMGAENNARIKALNDKISNDDLTSEEMQEALKESRLLAGVLIERFSDVDENDVENYKKEMKKRKEAEQLIKDSTVEVREEIKLKKEEEILAAEEEEDEEGVEEVVAPSADGRESKIKTIVDFFEENTEASEYELADLGLKNIKGANEIILVPDKYKLQRKSNGNYVLKKKSDNLFGWVLFGLSSVAAIFLGLKYLKKE